MTGSRDLAAFVRGLPKAELHVHIEGTLEPDLMFEMARRNGMTLPYRTVDEVRAAYEFTDLQSFLDIYYAAASVLITERDFDDLMDAYLVRAIDDGVRRAEIFFDPQTHTERGVTIDTVLAGFRAARDRHAGSISTDLILCFLRHLSPEAALSTLDAALATNRGEFIGVGLDSSERDLPPDLFIAAYRRAESEGLRLVAHAGEEGPASYVRSALDDLGVERIDHGVRAEDDPALIARLAASGTPLTMCPLSNERLRVVATLEDHNLKRLLDAGVTVTVNSDDPAYFGGYVADNYLAVAQALQLDRDDLVALARNSITASFLQEAEKRTLLDDLDRYAKRGRA